MFLLSNITQCSFNPTSCHILVLGVCVCVLVCVYLEYGRSPMNPPLPPQLEKAMADRPCLRNTGMKDAWKRRYSSTGVPSSPGERPEGARFSPLWPEGELDIRRSGPLTASDMHEMLPIPLSKCKP